uniref:Uncharacterized protein n=1 Tax=viral metagenome TaxID=1070528 RepID=A0A6M3II13_9ZZZZ
MNFLTVTYSGLSDDLLEQALKDTVRKFNYIHISTFLKSLDDNWEMEFRLIEQQGGDNGRS